MENKHMSELSRKKDPQVRGGEKLEFFQFFEKFSKMIKILLFSLQDNYNIQIHTFGWKMGTWVNWAKKVRQVRGGLKPHFFFDLLWSFRKWRKFSHSHSRTTEIYKFTHLEWAKTSIFSIFWKVFENVENPKFSIQDN